MIIYKKLQCLISFPCEDWGIGCFMIFLNFIYVSGFFPYVCISQTQNLLRSLNLISIRSRLKPVFHPWFGQCPSLEACHFWKVWRTVVKGLCHIPSSVFVGWNFFKCGKSHIFAARWHFLCHWNKGSKQVFFTILGHF